MQMSYMEEDRLKVQYYREFYLANQELFRTNPLLYQQEASKFIRGKLEKLLLENGDGTSKKGVQNM